MGSIEARTTVIAQNNIGRFVTECELAARDVIEEAVTDGARIAASLAPRRTGALAASIHPVVLSRTSGLWQTGVPYALPQETGSRPHPIPGSPDLRFWWEKAGRTFLPAREFYGIPEAITVVNHPGNPATRYLLRSSHAVMAGIIRIADKHYPG